MAKISIYKNALELAKHFSEFFLTLAKRYEKENKELHVALSGGSTPKIWFEVLKEHYLQQINWQLIHFYWGDERMLASDSSESNFGEANRILFSCKEIPNENIHPVDGLQEIDTEVERYSNLLSQNLNQKNNFPAFDLVILGMGDDGHTASIFPNQMHILESNNICHSAQHPASGQKRITLTSKTINNAKHVAFLITGKNKAEKLDCILNKRAESRLYPAAYIQPTWGKLQFFIDQAAEKTLKSAE